MQRDFALASIHPNAYYRVLENPGLQHPGSMLQSYFIIFAGYRICL